MMSSAPVATDTLAVLFGSSVPTAVPLALDGSGGDLASAMTGQGTAAFSSLVDQAMSLPTPSPEPMWGAVDDYGFVFESEGSPSGSGSVLGEAPPVPSDGSPLVRDAADLGWPSESSSELPASVDSESSIQPRPGRSTTVTVRGESEARVADAANARPNPTLVTRPAGAVYRAVSTEVEKSGAEVAKKPAHGESGLKSTSNPVRLPSSTAADSVDHGPGVGSTQSPATPLVSASGDETDRTSPSPSETAPPEATSGAVLAPPPLIAASAVEPVLDSAIAGMPNPLPATRPEAIQGSEPRTVPASTLKQEGTVPGKPSALSPGAGPVDLRAVYGRQQASPAAEAGRPSATGQVQQAQIAEEVEVTRGEAIRRGSPGVHADTDTDVETVLPTRNARVDSGPEIRAGQGSFAPRDLAPTEVASGPEPKPSESPRADLVPDEAVPKSSTSTLERSDVREAAYRTVVRNLGETEPTQRSAGPRESFGERSERSEVAQAGAVRPPLDAPIAVTHLRQMTLGQEPAAVARPELPLSDSAIQTPATSGKPASGDETASTLEVSRGGRPTNGGESGAGPMPDAGKPYPQVPPREGVPSGSGLEPARERVATSSPDPVGSGVGLQTGIEPRRPTVVETAVRPNSVPESGGTSREASGTPLPSGTGKPAVADAGARRTSLDDAPVSSGPEEGAKPSRTGMDARRGADPARGRNETTAAGEPGSDGGVEEPSARPSAGPRPDTRVAWTTGSTGREESASPSETRTRRAPAAGEAGLESQPTGLISRLQGGSTRSEATAVVRSESVTPSQSVPVEESAHVATEMVPSESGKGSRGGSGATESPRSLTSSPASEPLRDMPPSMPPRINVGESAEAPRSSETKPLRSETLPLRDAVRESNATAAVQETTSEGVEATTPRSDARVSEVAPRPSEATLARGGMATAQNGVGDANATSQFHERTPAEVGALPPRPAGNATAGTNVPHVDPSAFTTVGGTHDEDAASGSARVAPEKGSAPPANPTIQRPAPTQVRTGEPFVDHSVASTDARFTSAISGEPDRRRTADQVAPQAGTPLEGSGALVPPRIRGGVDAKNLERAEGTILPMESGTTEVTERLTSQDGEGTRPRDERAKANPGGATTHESGTGRETSGGKGPVLVPRTGEVEASAGTRSGDVDVADRPEAKESGTRTEPTKARPLATETRTRETQESLVRSRQSVDPAAPEAQVRPAAERPVAQVPTSDRSSGPVGRSRSEAVVLPPAQPSVQRLAAQTAEPARDGAAVTEGSKRPGMASRPEAGVTAPDRESRTLAGGPQDVRGSTQAPRMLRGMGGVRNPEQKSETGWSYSSVQAAVTAREAVVSTRTRMPDPGGVRTTTDAEAPDAGGKSVRLEPARSGAQTAELDRTGAATRMASASPSVREERMAGEISGKPANGGASDPQTLMGKVARGDADAARTTPNPAPPAESLSNRGVAAADSGKTEGSGRLAGTREDREKPRLETAVVDTTAVTTRPQPQSGGDKPGMTPPSPAAGMPMGAMRTETLRTTDGATSLVLPTVESETESTTDLRLAGNAERRQEVGSSAGSAQPVQVQVSGVSRPEVARETAVGAGTKEVLPKLGEPPGREAERLGMTNPIPAKESGLVPLPAGDGSWGNGRAGGSGMVAAVPGFPSSVEALANETGWSAGGEPLVRGRSDGTVGAVSGSGMRRSGKQEKSAVNGEQNLPETADLPTGAVLSSSGGREAGGRRSGMGSGSSHGAPHDDLAGILTGDTTAQVPGRGWAERGRVDGLMEPGASTEARVNRIEELISREVVRFRWTGQESVSVVIRPEPGTEVVVHLGQKEGQVEASLGFQRGEAAKFGAHWEQLQEALSDQNIRLMPMRESGAMPGPTLAGTNTGTNGNGNPGTGSGQGSGMGTGSGPGSGSGGSGSGSEWRETWGGVGDERTPDRRRAPEGGLVEAERHPTRAASTPRRESQRNERERPARPEGWEFWA